MKKEEPRSPELRFTEFSGNWVPLKLGDFISPCTEYPNEDDEYPLYSRFCRIQAVRV